MGTRADFYVGIGPTAEWLGSVSYDGYPDDGWPNTLVKGKHIPTDETSYRAEVEDIFSRCEKERSPFTRAAEGWPWPWEDSRTTDFAYAWVPFDVEAVSVARDSAIEAGGDPARLGVATSILISAGLERDLEVVDKGGWFWDLVAGRIKTPPAGRVLISCFGHEWHSWGFIEHYRLEERKDDDGYMGLRELRNDEVVDMRAKKMDTAGILAKSGMIILQEPSR